jgi:ankyrin repeat domain-containing protein 17
VLIFALFVCLSPLSQDGHVEVARLLLDSGAQVNMPADSFESPLTLAACGGHVELAALLIERGANLEEVSHQLFRLTNQTLDKYLQSDGSRAEV